MLDGTGSSPHPVVDVRPLECRTRCRGTTPDRALVRQTDLGVRADVEGQHSLHGVGQPAGEEHRHVVGADIAGDVRRQIERRTAIQLHADFLGAYHHRVAHRSDVGGLAQLAHRQAGHEVVHGGIPDHDRIDNLAAVGAGLHAQLAYHPVQLINQSLVQQLCGPDSGVRVGDTGHDVFAVGGLGIHRPDPGQRCPTGEVDQIGGQLGRPGVHGQAEQRPAGGLDGHQRPGAIWLPVDRRPSPPLLSSQPGRTRSCTPQADGGPSHARLSQCLLQPRGVGAQVSQRGRLEHEIDSDDRWVQREVHRLTFDLQTLRGAERLGGYLQAKSATHPRLTGQPPALATLGATQQALFLRCLIAELAIDRPYPTGAAGALPTTHRDQLDARRLRGLQDRHAWRHLHAPAHRLQFHADQSRGIGVNHGGRCALLGSGRSRPCCSNRRTRRRAPRPARCRSPSRSTFSAPSWTPPSA